MENKPPTKRKVNSPKVVTEPTPPILKQIEETETTIDVDNVDNSVDKQETPKEEKNVEVIVGQEAPKGRQPKKRGNMLFTISANVKIADKRYNVTRIIEEENEKKAKIMFEKTIKMDIGKPKSITKYTINQYNVDDEDATEEIVDVIKVEEKKELTLFEKALNILCTSPYIHLYKIPSPKMGNGKFHYGVYMDDEHLKYSLNKEFEEAKKSTGELDIDIQSLDRGLRKEAEKLLNQNTAFYNKMLNGSKQLSEQEIKADKNAIKHVGTISEEGLNMIIEVHNREEYEEKNKVSIFRDNLKKVLSIDGFQLFCTKIEEIEDSGLLIVAKNINQAKQLSSCSGYTIDLLTKYGRTLADKEGSVNMRTGTVTGDNLQKILSNDKIIEQIIEKDTFTTQILLDSDFSLDTLNQVLDRVDKMNDKRDVANNRNAINALMNNDTIVEKIQNSMKNFTGRNVKEVLDNIKESRGKNVKPTRNIIN